MASSDQRQGRLWSNETANIVAPTFFLSACAHTQTRHTRVTSVAAAATAAAGGTAPVVVVVTTGGVVVGTTSGGSVVRATHAGPCKRRHRPSKLAVMTCTTFDITNPLNDW